MPGSNKKVLFIYPFSFSFGIDIYKHVLSLSSYWNDFSQHVLLPPFSQMQFIVFSIVSGLGHPQTKAIGTNLRRQTSCNCCLCRRKTPCCHPRNQQTGRCWCQLMWKKCWTSLVHCLVSRKKSLRNVKNNTFDGKPLTYFLLKVRGSNSVIPL